MLCSCSSLKSQQFYLVQICTLLRFIQSSLSFYLKKIIDRGENCIPPRCASNTPNFGTNCMDPHTIRESVFQVTNLYLHLGKILSLCGVISKISLLQNLCPSQYVYQLPYVTYTIVYKDRFTIRHFLMYQHHLQ